MAGLGTKVTFLTLFTVKLLRLLMEKAAMRLIIPTVTHHCDICYGGKISPAPVGGMTEMRNAGCYMWQHFNLQTPQT